MERCLSQTRRMVETPAAQSPLLLAHPELADGQRESLLAAIEQHVRPAHAAWLALLERCAGSVPAPATACATSLTARRSTATTSSPGPTLAEDPRAIHAHGLERLAEIEAQERHIAAELGHAEIATLRRELDRSPENHVEASPELVSLAGELIERAEDRGGALVRSPAPGGL